MPRVHIGAELRMGIFAVNFWYSLLAQALVLAALLSISNYLAEKKVLRGQDGDAKSVPRSGPVLVGHATTHPGATPASQVGPKVCSRPLPARDVRAALRGLLAAVDPLSPVRTRSHLPAGPSHLEHIDPMQPRLDEGTFRRSPTWLNSMAAVPPRPSSPAGLSGVGSAATSTASASRCL